MRFDYTITFRESTEFKGVIHLSPYLLVGSFPHKLVEWKMGAAPNAESSAVKLGVAGIRFGQCDAH